MASGKTCAKISFASLVSLLILAGLIVSVVILSKLENGSYFTTEQDGGGGGEVSPAPAPNSSAITTAIPPTTTQIPTTPPATAYPYTYNYDGKFTDRKSTWDPLLGVPKSQVFRDHQQKYTDKIQSLLDKTFHQAYAYVSFFSKDVDEIGVNFVINLLNSSNPQAPSSKTLQIDLEMAAASSGLKWLPISISNEEPEPLAPVSREQGWKDAAAMFLESIDTKFDPCNDFFSFTCNKWIEAHPLIYTPSVNHFSLLQEKIDKRLQKLLGEPQPVNGSKTLRTASKFYKTCVEMDPSTLNGTRRVLAVMDSLGGWPILQEKNDTVGNIDELRRLVTNYFRGNKSSSSSSWSFVESLTRSTSSFWSKLDKPAARRLEEENNVIDILNSLGGGGDGVEDGPRGDTTRAFADPSGDIARVMGLLYNSYKVPTLFPPMVDIDWRNVSRNRLYLDQAALSVPASIFLMYPEEIMRQIVMTIAQAALVFADVTGAQLDPQTVFEDAANVAQFELLLAKISVPAADQRNQSAMYNPYDLRAASERWSAVDWKTYLDSLTVGYEVPAENIEPFIITQPGYVDSLAHQILPPMMYELEVGPRIIYNYLFWRFVSQYDMFTGGDLYKAGAALRLKRNPSTDAMPPPPRACAQMIQELIPWAAGRLYVDEYFTFAERLKADVMVRGILSAFRGQLSGLRWMDDYSKLMSMNKIYYLVKNVAYPDFLKDDALLDEYYARINDAVEQHPDVDFLDFYVILISTQVLRELTNLGSPPDRTDFGMSPTIVNAWYAPEMNSINLPAAILHEPFFRADFPMAVNYGALGTVMGHELTHGFDDQGVQYDSDGSLHDWMTEYSKRGFVQMADCAVAEYGRFCFNVTGRRMCVNGRATQGENIADNGGIKSAYQEYRAYVASNGDEMRLPGMESYTMDQVFFLSFGHVWCSAQTSSQLGTQLLLDPHSPPPVRVAGTLQNFPPFAAAFGCRPGDRMYPRDHCNVW